MLQQAIDGVDVGLGQLKALDDALGDSSVGQSRLPLGPPLSTEGQGQLSCTYTIMVSCPLPVVRYVASSSGYGAISPRVVLSGPVRSEASSLMRGRVSNPAEAVSVGQGQISQGQ